MTPNRLSSYRIIEKINTEYPNIHIVIGGIHTTLMYEQLLTKYPFLTAVLGEGEITMNELAIELNSAFEWKDFFDFYQMKSRKVTLF